MWSGSIADEEEGDIVSLACSASEALDRFENRLFQMVQGDGLLAGENLAKPGNPKHLFVGVLGISNAVAKEDECVVRLEFCTEGGVFRLKEHTDRARTFGEGLGDNTFTEKER